jgi:hypothetical protein
MAAKAEISWNRRTTEGLKVQVYARRLGNRWRFFTRARRYERWASVAVPPLEDWLALLDAVRRRIGRRLLRPEEAVRLRQAIRERFPDARV